MVLYPVKNPSAFAYRDYYKDTQHNRLYCHELGTWYACSGTEGEPSYSLTTAQIDQIVFE